MSQRLTMKQLKESLDRLSSEVKDLRADLGVVKVDIKEVKEGVGSLPIMFSNLQSSVDKYYKKTETWHQEQEVLGSQHDRLQKSLIRKNVITEAEILS